MVFSFMNADDLRFQNIKHKQYLQSLKLIMQQDYIKYEQCLYSKFEDLLPMKY